MSDVKKYGLATAQINTILNNVCLNTKILILNWLNIDFLAIIDSKRIWPFWDFFPAKREIN